ncbi:ABC transporter ATP-binding protein [Paenibacillus thailandensis]|uniref:ABC transporter ATP-binding protein n=1 Tax=Paenibacillus thailandensis TaxID=393250 RepID=A0ABW5R3A2_9BACL
MSAVVEVKGLTKRYGDTTVLNAIDFTLKEGKIYGLLGRNGAGKTTIMHMLAAQLFPTKGTVKVFGENPYENKRVLDRICFIKESQRYPETFKVSDVLGVAETLFPNWDRRYAENLLEQFDLPRNRPVKKLSRGMTSSVGIIVGLASRAPLTIFDEPYLGLDAVARSMFYELLLEDYANHPRTVILSTHLIDEVSQLLEHVIVIDKGEILFDEEADTLRDKGYTVAGPAGKVNSFVGDKEVVSSSALGGFSTATVIGVSAGEKEEAEKLGLDIVPVSLQELIVHLTGKRKRQTEGGFGA